MLPKTLFPRTGQTLSIEGVVEDLEGSATHTGASGWQPVCQGEEEECLRYWHP